MSENAVKAKLKIQLLAEKVLVAESTDEKLWRKILAAMQGDGDVAESDDTEDLGSGARSASSSTSRKKGQKGLAGFAADLGLDEDVVEGACSPSDEAPFIHLDDGCWESLKKNTPERGSKAVAAINLAATLLCLWFKHSGQDVNPTAVQAKAVLQTIGVSEKNPSRAVKNCEWLQSRGGGIQLNPARVSKAKAIVRAYCSQEPVGGEG